MILGRSESFAGTYIMSFQEGIGSFGGTVFFRWDFVPLCELWQMDNVRPKNDASTLDSL